MKHTPALLCLIAAVSFVPVVSTGCEEKAPPPAQGGGGGGGRMGDLARGVRDTVKNTEGAINANQQQAVDAANDVQSGGASQAGKSFGLAGVEFTLQPGWTAAPASNEMRKAELIHKGSAGEVSAVFFTLGGTAEENLARWETQVEPVSGGEPKRTSQTVNGLTVRKVDMRGSYSGMSPSNVRTPAQGNTRFIGVVIEGGRGPIQIRLVGPEQAVNEAAAGFDAMLGSIRKN